MHATRCLPRFLVLFCFLAAHGGPGLAIAPNNQELAARASWAAAKFKGVTNTAPLPSGLHVLENHDPVQLNSRANRPMRLGQTTFPRGLYCHATSRLLVRLPSAAASFSAVVGVDSNDHTSGGRGSVRFSVIQGGREAFRSDTLREGAPPLPVKVDLAGAREFLLQVDDAGDGISCDQADWADAKVLLQDGTEVWLGDLPLQEGSGPGPLSTEPPFTFIYGNQRFADLPWRTTRTTRTLDVHRTEHTLTCTDDRTGLEVRCIAIEYQDFPALEWTVHFKNTGSQPTPLISDIRALDASFHPGASGSPTLHHFTGSPCRPTDFEPFATLLQPGATKHITAAGGRPSNSDLPYFNLAWQSHNLIVAVGWPGQWAAHFTRNQDASLRIEAGQETTRFKLLPNESVRTPLIAMLFGSGDWIRAQNLWRRWMLAHNLPRPGGKLPPVQMAACSSHQFGEMIRADTANQILFVDRYLEEKLPLDYWWMDAGWYPCNGEWPRTGTWEVDTRRFPGGLREITDHAHKKGVRSIVWFEPERVHPGTWLSHNHPDWILGGEAGGLLNLGNPEARQWLIDHVDNLLTRQGIDLYRQDFNMDPLDAWRKNDPDDRQGITENHHVTGYLAYWDELRRRHPDLLIDSCASGGRRNDLETMRRAVPLLRSDYIMEPVGNQGHTYGLSFWLPYQGTGTGSGALSPYLLRSTLLTHFTACFDVRRKDLDYDLLRRLLGQWRRYAANYFGDYYPLTPYSLDQTTWMAWQFDRPETGEGLVQAFRRDASLYEAARFKLQGLDPAARYRITNLDSGENRQFTGQNLLESGLPVAITSQPGDVVITYAKEP